jgi:hypothetical protein
LQGLARVVVGRRGAGEAIVAVAKALAWAEGDVVGARNRAAVSPRHAELSGGEVAM